MLKNVKVFAAKCPAQVCFAVSFCQKLREDDHIGFIFRIDCAIIKMCSSVNKISELGEYYDKAS